MIWHNKHLINDALFRAAFQSGSEQNGITGEVLAEENISKILG